MQSGNHRKNFEGLQKLAMNFLGHGIFIHHGGENDRDSCGVFFPLQFWEKKK